MCAGHGPCSRIYQRLQLYAGLADLSSRRRARDRQAGTGTECALAHDGGNDAGMGCFRAGANVYGLSGESDGVDADHFKRLRIDTSGTEPGALLTLMISTRALKEIDMDPLNNRPNLNLSTSPLATSKAQASTAPPSHPE